MTALRFSRFGPKVSALCLFVTVAGSEAVFAQGFGADPFRPYNNQYDAYTYPLGPPGADAAASAAMMRSGLRGANQFQNYLTEMQGLGRAGTERYGQGLPYYRSVIDPRLDPDGKRDYRPNGEIERSFEKVQQRLTTKYLAYLNERDPQKRGQLLREFQRARRQTSRALSVRREDPRRFEEAATRTDLGSGGRASTSARDAVTPKSASRSAVPGSRSSEPTTGTAPGAAAPPPRRSARSGSLSGTQRTPSEVLDRARRMEGLRGTGRSTRDSGTDRSEGARMPLDRSTPDE